MSHDGTKNRAVRALLLACLSGAALGVVGCSSSDTSLSGLQSNPSPELKTLTQREDDVDNALAIMEDENWRMFNQDLGRALYLDRPSRLTREPMPR